MLFRAR